MSEQFDTAPPRRFSPGLVGAIVTAIVVLAVIGATVGYFAAGGSNLASDNDPTTGPTPTSGATATTDAPSPTPAETPTSAPTNTGRPPTNGFTLPDLSNLDFQEARRQVRALGLGWNLTFGEPGDDSKVSRTQPAAGATVRRGTTIRLFIRGAAPEVGVPGVVGLTCQQAAELVVDHGLYPRYPTGPRGTVWAQSPEAGMTGVHWNDTVQLTCALTSPGASSP